MIAAEVKRFAPIRHRPDQDCFPRPVIILRIVLRRLLVKVAADGDQIESGGSEMADLATLLPRDVAGHRKRLQVNLGAHNRRAVVEDRAAFQVFDRLREYQKVSVRAGPERRAVAVGVLVDDVVTEADVNGYGNSQTVPGGEDTQILVREIAFCNGLPDRFAHSESFAVSLGHDVVDLRRLFPETELADLDVPGHAFGRFADPGQFVIVDRPRAIHGEVGENPRSMRSIR